MKVRELQALLEDKDMEDDVIIEHDGNEYMIGQLWQYQDGCSMGDIVISTLEE